MLINAGESLDDDDEEDDEDDATFNNINDDHDDHGPGGEQKRIAIVASAPPAVGLVVPRWLRPRITTNPPPYGRCPFRRHLAGTATTSVC